jgi:putative membrane-bound dehydrogenase-like protein
MRAALLILPPVLSLAALLPATALAQAVGKFDQVPVNAADEAYIFTPPGFEKEGKPAVARGEGTGRVHVIVRDRATRARAPCRVNVVGADGNFYRPEPDPLTPYDLTGAYPEHRGNRPSKAPIRYLGRFFYTLGEFTAVVPAGPVRIEVWKGFEYAPRSLSARAGAGETLNLELEMTRAVPMAERDYWSGDPHVHLERRGREGDKIALDLLEAEDLQHVALLSYNADTSSYTGLMEKQETPQLLGLGLPTVQGRGLHSILSAQEYRSNHYGHILLFLREQMALPGTTLDPSTWPVYGRVGRETQDQGGFAVYAHGGYAQEVCADFVEGNVNGVELLQFGIYRGIGLDGWYRILNAGFRFPATGASDYPMCRWLGDARTYAYHRGRPSFKEWLEAIAAGRSFVTTGPLLLLEVEGEKPGAVLARSGPGPHRLTAKARVRCEVTPVTSLQIIVNGQVVEELHAPPGHEKQSWIELEKALELSQPSWVAARAFSKAPGGSPDAEAHTNPVYIYLDGRAPFSAPAIDGLIEDLDVQIAPLERRIFPRQLEALAYFRRARERLLEIKKAGNALARPKVAGVEAQSPDPSIQAFLKPVPPKEPAAALAEIEVVKGFHLELVAAEPLVTSPVAGAFDEDGRLYVAEMRDYPYKPKPGDPPLGRVTLLEDTDGDGKLDRSTVFQDQLLWPSGMAPWKGGVFVTAPPDVWYLRDTDGDRRADERRKIYTGFGTGNQQGMLNNLAWGLDHKVYGATSMEGGEVRPADKPEAKPVSVRGRDFRFDPVTGAFETITGTAQFGNAFDDWGNRFVCSESRPALHVVLPQEYMVRNPYVTAPEAIKNIADGGTFVFRTSPVEGWRLIRSSVRVATEYQPASSAAVSHDLMTAAAGVTIYRGDAYPEELRGDLFVSDPQTNVIHHRRLLPDGVTFKAIRAEEKTEFVRSSDLWFRPVNLLNAPDGTLYALDMYREFIESVHIPFEVARLLDLTSGRDRGRIYRIEPSGLKPSPPPRLSGASTGELVDQLEKKNGWRRDTAHRLIYERQDRSAVEPLRRLLNSPLPQARLHALGSLRGLSSLEEGDLLRALQDPSPEVRENALRLAEPSLRASGNLLEKALALAGDGSPRVKFQAALSLGEARDSRIAPSLAGIAREHAADSYLRAAVLSSAAEAAPGLLQELLRTEDFAKSDAGKSFLEELSRTAGARGDPAVAGEALDSLRGPGLAGNLQLARHLLVALLQGWKRSRGDIEGLETSLSPPARTFVEDLQTWARGIVSSGSSPEGDAIEALQAVSCGSLDPRLMQAIGALLSSEKPQGARAAAVRALKSWPDPAIAPVLLEPWASYSPPVKSEAIQALLSRKEWILPLFDAIEKGEVASGEIDRARREVLLEHADPVVRERAKKILGAGEAGPRREAMARYRSALSLPGDAERGGLVFEKHCATCHLYRGKGHAVGPNLALTKDQVPEVLLEEILDPNREVSPAYVEYSVVDKEAQVFTGILAQETEAGITLLRPQGLRDTILRPDIVEVRNSGRSLMPEGLETAVSPQEMVDLIAFILQGRYDLGTLPGILEPPDAATVPLPQDERIRAQLRLSLERYVTPGDWIARREGLRQGVLRGAGLWPLPSRPELHVMRHGFREHQGYSVENIALETIPGFYLTGNLYRPLGRTGPLPGVLCPHGHFKPLGRFRPEHQVRCAQLARMGAAVFSYGMVGWQDSQQTTHDDPLVLALQLWNSLRATDFLSGLDGVDPKRLGCTGASGGGTQTLLLAAVDERIKASAPAVIIYPWSWFSTSACKCENGLPTMKSPETNVLELAAAVAPRDQLIISCGFQTEGSPEKDLTHDFPAVGLPFIKEVYRRTGSESHLRALHLAEEAHDYGPSKRKAAYVFFAETLGLELLAEDLKAITIEPQEALEVFGPGHPLPADAIHGSAAVDEAFSRLR